MKDQLTISSEVDNRNSAICRFTVNRTLHIGTASFDDRGQAEQSLLAQKLFDIEGIKRVLLVGHSLVLQRHQQNGKTLSNRVRRSSKHFLLSGSPLSQEQVEDRMMLIGRGNQREGSVFVRSYLRKEITEILQDIDVTDHAAGMNPYYRPAK